MLKDKSLLIISSLIIVIVLLLLALVDAIETVSILSKRNLRKRLRQRTPQGLKVDVPLCH